MPLDFVKHPVFVKEAAALQRRFQITDGVERLQRLFEVQFNPTHPRLVIAPGKLHRVTQNDVYSVWKVEMGVVGMRSNQFPRVWFAVKGAVIVFLCIASHVDGYRDNDKEREALLRVNDVL